MPGSLVSGGSAVASATINADAAKQAAQTAQQTAQMNNALETSIYNQNTANLSPYMQRGNAAGDELNDLLGLGAGSGSSASTTSTYAPAGISTSPQVVGAGKNNAFAGISEGGITTDQANSILSSRPDIGQAYSKLPSGTQASFGSPQAYAAYWYNSPNGKAAGYQIPTASGTGTSALSAAAAPTSSGPSGNSGLDTYLNSTDYKFNYGQGLEAVEQAKATQGLLGSGANLKAVSTYGQNTAQSAITSYMNTLAAQQQTGLSGANALAGVGTGYAGATSANNNTAASASINAGLTSAAGTTNAINSALAAYQTNANQGSSYGGADPNAAWAGGPPVAALSAPSYDYATMGA